MKYGTEWTPGIVLVGAVIIFPLVPSFALIALVVTALAAVAALVALAGALLATPYLLVRAVRRRLAERHKPLGPYRPRRTNDSKVIKVNPSAPPALVEKPYEAVDEPIARVLSRAHG